MLRLRIDEWGDAAAAARGYGATGLRSYGVTGLLGYGVRGFGLRGCRICTIPKVKPHDRRRADLASVKALRVEIFPKGKYYPCLDGGTDNIMVSGLAALL